MTVLSDEVVVTHRSGTLYDVMELILDRGMVIDAFVRISLVGIEIVKIDARIVVASVDTYLRFAEACNRLDLEHDSSSRTVPELLGGGGAGMAKKVGKAGAKKAIKSVGDKAKDVKGALTSGDGDEDEEGEDEMERQPARRRRTTSKDDGGPRRRRRAEGE